MHRGAASGSAPGNRKAIDFAALDAALRLRTAEAIARCCRRWALVFCAAEDAGAWQDALEGVGLHYWGTRHWVKRGAAPQFNGRGPSIGVETIAIAHAPGVQRWNGRGRVGAFHHVAARGAERVGHPTQKPIALLRELVELFTDPRELVADPFAGVATTGVACLELGRRFVGWELDPRWARAGQQRLKKTRGGS